MVFGFFWPSRAKLRVRFSAKTGVIALIGLAMPAAFAQTKPLNDTGITFCGGVTTGNNNPCLAGDPPGQDKYYGRDAAALAGTLTKTGGSAGGVGGGANGFDFSKIANNGSGLLDTAVLGPNPTDWGCTRDNLTGLIWEMKTTSGLRSLNHTYSWYQTGSPDGNNGTASGGTCETTGRCDTEKYVQDVNAAGLCGFSSGWRMPTVKELEGIADLGRTLPAIDPAYFPYTHAQAFVWSGSPNAGSAQVAWSVDFNVGVANNYPRSLSDYDAN